MNPTSGRTALRLSPAAYRIAAGVLVLIAVLRIVSTYRVFSQTWDEPSSIAAGMEWLDRGSYTWDTKHPPLGRAPTALALYLRGARSIGHPDPRNEGQFPEGTALLAWKGEYRLNLALARLGVLPFFVAASWVVWAWTSWAFGRAAALTAVFLFTSTPPILGHAGVAMTDIAVTATLPAALLGFCLWLKRPTMARTLLFGAALGLAILSKFTAVAFFAAAAFPLTISRRWLARPPRAAMRSLLRPILLAALACALTIWAGYRFSLTPSKPKGTRPAVDSIAGATGFWHDAAYRVLETPVPAGAAANGIYQLLHHNGEHAHPNYFLGQASWTGWLLFYPILLAVKTPVALLILAGIGVVAIVKDRGAHWPFLTPLWSAAGILMAGFLSQVNTGIRHVLPIYVMLAVIAAFGAMRLLRAGPRWACLCAALLAWHTGSSAAAHPDYLSYFNELAIGEAGFYGVDSDLDWGQDLWRLSAACAQRRVDSLWVAYYGSADLNQFSLPAWRALPPGLPQSGWIAISMHKLKLGEGAEGSPESLAAYSWLEKYRPVALVGKSMRLYFIPPQSGAL